MALDKFCVRAIIACVGLAYVVCKIFSRKTFIDSCNADNNLWKLC